MESVSLPLCVCLSFVRLIIFSACVSARVCSCPCVECVVKGVLECAVHVCVCVCMGVCA